MKQELPISELVNYRRNFLFEHGYNFCELCGRSDQYRYEVHHIVYRSESPKHKNINHEDNLVLLCKKCHDYLHEQKNRRQELEKWDRTKKVMQKK